MKPPAQKQAAGMPAVAPPNTVDTDIATLEQQQRALQTELNNTQTAIEAVKKNRIVRIGLCGVPGSGKSSLLAAWYLFREDRSDGKNKLLLRFRDDDSIAYMKRVTEHILTTGGSKPTHMLEPINILFDLLINEEEWQVQTMDFAGHFVELLSEEEEKRLAQPARDFLAKCDAILCCHYWNDGSQETLDAINRVLQRFRSQFILAITRLDETGGVPQSKEDLDDVLQGLQDSSRYFRNLIADIRHISRRSGTVYAIAVCPLGNDFSDHSNPGKPLPSRLSVEDLNPIGIFSPLRLAVERKKNREPHLHEHLQRVKSDLDRVAAELREENEKKERQRQVQLERLQEQFTEFEGEILQCLDCKRVPRYRDRMTLTEYAQNASDLGDKQLQMSCSFLMKRIETAETRAADRWRQIRDLVVLVFVAIVCGVPLFWIAWRVLRQ